MTPSLSNSNPRLPPSSQLFRADTPRFHKLVQTWIEKRFAAEWKGNFVGEEGVEYYGLPNKPPFYCGIGGMQSISKGLLNGGPNDKEDCAYTKSITVYEGQRVAKVDRQGAKWHLYGTSGAAAFHDTSEKVAKKASAQAVGDGIPYDVVVLTGISSSAFAAWHRSSAGIPDTFRERVLRRAGARVPMFTTMIAFEHDLPLDVSAAVVNDPTLWVATRTKAKPGLEDLELDCWALVSTPEYAIAKIEETPMQDPKTGEFIPQHPDYLTTVPGPDLERAFRRIVQEGRLGKIDGPLPKTAYLGAQRWGSAMPAHQHLTERSPTRKIIGGVPYDGGRGQQAPTVCVQKNLQSFVADDEQLLFQAGDMMSTYSPGFEGAALSGVDAAHYIFDLLEKLRGNTNDDDDDDDDEQPHMMSSSSRR